MKGAKEIEEEEECGGCKSLEEEIYWKHINPICFFVAFRSDFHHKLQIPKKFAENIIPNILHEKLTVQGPSGASWELNMVKSVDGHFLQDGWEEFVNAYSLEENDTLLFTYDRRKSSFDVKIFDGECEKVDAYFVKKCGHNSPAVKSHKKRLLSEVIDDSDDELCVAAKESHKDVGTQPVNHRKQVDGLKGCIKTSKKMLSHRKRVQFAIDFVRKKGASRSSMEQQGRSNNELLAQMSISAETEFAKPPEKNGPSNKELLAQNGSANNEVVPFVDQNPLEALEKTPPGFEKVVLPGTRCRSTNGSRLIKRAAPAAEYVSNRRPVTNQEKTEALKKAALELTDNSFFASMPYSSCYKGFFMAIPARFASTHLGLRNQEVILRVEKKKWKTEFSFSLGGLGAGWMKFALDNNLEESDACLFKLVSRESGKTVMLDVAIFRVVEDVVTPPTLLMRPRNIVQ